MLESNTTKDESDPFPNDDASEEPAGKNYWALILGLLCIVVVFGNVLVIASVVREKVLQNVTNFFIVSLAVADLLVAGCVMPFSVYVLVSLFILFFKYWYFLVLLGIKKYVLVSLFIRFSVKY